MLKHITTEDLPKMLGDVKGACEDWNKSKKLGNEEAKIILKNNYCK